MQIPPPGALARKLGLTILCILAARGCASDLERAAAAVYHATPAQATIIQYPLPPPLDPIAVRHALRPYVPQTHTREYTEARYE